MGLARGFERRLEELVDGLAARLFRGRVHPVELATRIVREADLAAYETQAGTGVPNAFDVMLGGETEGPDAVATAERELEHAMAETAAERGWRLEGPVTVRIHFGAGPASHVEVVAVVEPGPIPPWARLETEAGDPIDVSHNRSIIGRSSSADVHLSADEASRQHALLWREAGGIWIVDLSSSNGTYLNGERISEVVDVFDGDRLGFGSVELTMRML